MEIRINIIYIYILILKKFYEKLILKSKFILLTINNKHFNRIELFHLYLIIANSLIIPTELCSFLKIF